MIHSVDSTYLVLGARYLRRQVRQLVDQLGGARLGEEAECVHRARVASRRLRAALRMFRDGWSRKRVERWRSEIRRVTKSLGEARDKDVQIEVLYGILRTAEGPGCAAGLVRLLVETQRDRDALEPAVLEAADRIERSGVLDEILSAAKKVLARSEAAGDESSPAACRQAGQFVLERLEQLLARQDSLDDPDDCEGHHALRIAVKRLRYTLEVAKPLCPGQLEEAVNAAKRLQTLLGDVHDCDVWQDQLAKFARRESARWTKRCGGQGRFARLVPGIEYLKRERAERRGVVFQELVRYWRELKQQETWQRLRGLVEYHGAAESGAPPPATGAEPPRRGPEPPRSGPEPPRSGPAVREVPGAIPPRTSSFPAAGPTSVVPAPSAPAAPPASNGGQRAIPKPKALGDSSRRPALLVRG
ncbi:MAG: CHAD domain-containing protein [Thermoguttaceae bacterium]|jgi:CHAD domain-containing protein